METGAYSPCMFLLSEEDRGVCRSTESSIGENERASALESFWPFATTAACWPPCDSALEDGSGASKVLQECVCWCLPTCVA
jgi:hypothetical protein